MGQASNQARSLDLDQATVRPSPRRERLCPDSSRRRFIFLRRNRLRLKLRKDGRGQAARPSTISFVCRSRTATGKRDGSACAPSLRARRKQIWGLWQRVRLVWRKPRGLKQRHGELAAHSGGTRSI
jgi:hypothetical protein